jgi:hypothetical protein
MDYFVIKFRNHPVVAFSSAITLRDVWKLRKYAPRNSLKRRVFSECIPILFLLKKLFKRASTGVVSADVETLLESVIDGANITELRTEKTMLAWPGESTRKRLYIHCLNHDGEPVAFAKISTESDARCRDKIEKEKECLKSFSGVANAVAVPRLLGWQSTPDACCLLVSNCIGDAAPYFGEWELLGEGLKSLMALDAKEERSDCIDREDWWRRGAELYPNTISSVRQLLGKEKEWYSCPAHGDLGPANVLISDGQLLILDWEEFNLRAPAFSDRLVYWLSLKHDKIVSAPDVVLNELLSEFEASKSAILIALIYLSSSGAGKSRIVIEELERSLSADLISE